MTSVKVAVRVRPFNKQEKDEKATNCITMEGPMIHITNLEEKKESNFTFDHCFWSCDGYTADEEGYFLPTPDSNYADQKMVFGIMGQYVIDAAFDGFNTCLFAYGQTGAGKSYTMFGYGPNAGIVPRTLSTFFKRQENETIKGKLEFEVEMSMLQIYNQQVLDLLVPPKKKSEKKNGLDIRERPSGEIFVQDLTWVRVNGLEDVENELQFGNCNRTIRATNMNQTSGRGHTVVSILLRRIQYLEKETEQVKKAKPTAKVVPGKKGADHDDQRKVMETTVNLVDLAGSQNLGGKTKVVNKKRLLEGGNINKSLSVLWKCITILADKSVGKNKTAVVPYRQSKLTRFLQNNLGGNSKTAMVAAISPASTMYDETLYTLYYAYEVKKIKNKAISKGLSSNQMLIELKRRNEMMREQLGEDGLNKALSKPHWKTRYHLKNLNQDPLLTGTIRHLLQNGDNKVGSGGDNEVEIGGIGVTHDHCKIEIDEDTGNCMIYPNNQSPVKHQTLVNGQLLEHPEKLKHLDRVRFGLHNYFVFIDPNEVDGKEDFYDWQFAHDEALRNNQMDINKYGHLETKEYKDTMQQLENLKMEKENLRLQGIKRMKELEEDHDKKQRNIEDEYRKELENALPRQRAKIEAKLKAELDELARKKEQSKQIQELEQIDLLDAIRKKEREDLAKRLQDLFQKLVIANEVCGMIGKYNYSYEPFIDIETNGKEQRSVLRVKAFPDRNNKEVYNVWNLDDFDLIYDNVLAYWDEYQYEDDDDEDRNESNAERERRKQREKEQKDRRIAETFGMATEDQRWILIGTSHLFLNGAYNLIEMPIDTTPIIDKAGKAKGTLRYSLSPIVYNRIGNPQNLSEYYSLEDCQGKDVGIQLKLESASNLPSQHTYKTKCTYHFPYNLQKFQSPIVQNCKDPDYNSGEVHRFKVDSNFNKDLENEVVKVEVWGMAYPDSLTLKTDEKKKVNGRAGSVSSEQKYSTLSLLQQVPMHQLDKQQQRKILRSIKKIQSKINSGDRLKAELQKMKKKGFGRKETCCCQIF